MKFKFLGVIGIAFFVFIISRLNLASLWLNLQNMIIPLFILSLVFTTIDVLIKVFRWRYIYSRLGVHLSVFTAITIWFKSLFAETTPGKVGAVLIKAHISKQGKDGFGKALFSVTFDMIMEIVTMVLVAIVAVVFFVGMISANIIVIPIALFGIGLIMLYIFRKEDIARKFLGPVYRIFIPEKYKSKAKLVFESFYEGLKKVDMQTILVSQLFSLVGLAVMGISLWILAMALNLTVPLHYLILYVPINTLLVALPITISGVGTRESGFIILFGLFGISAEAAVIFSLLLLFQRIILMLPGIILLNKRETTVEHTMDIA